MDIDLILDQFLANKYDEESPLEKDWTLDDEPKLAMTQEYEPVEGWRS